MPNKMLATLRLRPATSDLNGISTPYDGTEAVSLPTELIIRLKLSRASAYRKVERRELWRNNEMQGL